MKTGFRPVRPDVEWGILVDASIPFGGVRRNEVLLQDQ